MHRLLLLRLLRRMIGGSASARRRRVAWRTSPGCSVARFCVAWRWAARRAGPWRSIAWRSVAWCCVSRRAGPRRSVAWGAGPRRRIARRRIARRRIARRSVAWRCVSRRAGPRRSVARRTGPRRHVPRRSIARRPGSRRSTPRTTSPGSAGCSACAGSGAPTATAARLYDPAGPWPPVPLHVRLPSGLAELIAAEAKGARGDECTYHHYSRGRVASHGHLLGASHVAPSVPRELEPPPVAAP
jgi:hypothetical protein